MMIRLRPLLAGQDVAAFIHPHKLAAARQRPDVVPVQAAGQVDRGNIPESRQLAQGDIGRLEPCDADPGDVALSVIGVWVAPLDLAQVPVISQTADRSQADLEIAGRFRQHQVAIELEKAFAP